MPSNDGLSTTVGLILVLVAISVMIPAIFINLQNPQTTVFDQFQNERLTVTGEVSSEITELTNQDEVNITLLNRRSGDFAATGQLQKGENTTVQLDGQNITVTIIDVYENDNEAIVEYNYPLYLGWPDGAEVIVKGLTELLIIMAVILGVGTIMTVKDLF